LGIFEFKYNIHGGHFFILFVYAAIKFRWRGLLLTWLFSIALIAPRIWYLTSDMPSFIANMIFLLIPLMVMLTVHLHRVWREAVKKAAIQREEEQRAYIAEIIDAQENERIRISREIHDDTAQSLWILASDARHLITEDLTEAFPQTVRGLETLRDEIIRIYDETKRISLALRPGILDDLGLIPALRWQIDQMNSNNSFKACLLVEGKQRQIDNETSTHMFRIVQEALNNAKRHSGTSEATVTFVFHPKTIKLIITDNGQGFSISEINKLYNENKLGIIGLQERARLIGGTCRISSGVGKGTKVSIVFNDSPSHDGKKPKNCKRQDVANPRNDSAGERIELPHLS
jgi:signal transduction histidine kinase